MDPVARPLTLEEARRRGDLVDVDGYEIDLDLTRGAEVFGSRTVVRFRCSRPGASTFVELRPSRLLGATLNGAPVDPSRLSGNRLELAGLASENELVVDADLPYSVTGEGMHRFVDPLDGEAYAGAYLGVDLAQRVFAVFDQPDLKAPIAARVTAPDGWTVVSNGRCTARDADGRWVFATTPPVSPYLFTVVAGPLYSVEAEHRGLGFALHCRRSLAEHLDRNAAEILAVTTACFDRYAEVFDEPYAFDSYDQAFVPELNWGALEAPGCILLRDDYVFRSAVTEAQRLHRGTVIAHEMAHMWFGDLVTMRWWDDLWLSESFAEYMGFQVLAEATRFTGAWASFTMDLKTWGYDCDQRPSTHPIAPDSRHVTDTETALANFDGISYAKGASALRQLGAWLGADVFLLGVNDFLRTHRFGVATLTDLLDALGRASGLDVRAWAGSWLATAGVDTLRVVRGHPGVGGCVVDHEGTRPHRVTVGLYDRAPGPGGRLVLRRALTVDLEAGARSVRVDLPRDEGEPALLLLNATDDTYAKVRLDVDSAAAATAGLSTIDDPLARAVVWTALRDQVRDGELAPSAYLDVVDRQLPLETETAVAQGVLAFALPHVVDRFLAAGARPAWLETLGGTCRAVLDRDPGGDPGLRLVAARGVVDSATGAEGVAELRGWLDAGSVPGGPVLDADLRWRVLLRLSVLGEVGPEEVDAEQVRDRSGSGPEGAARCRAARPALDAKEMAWDTMFGRPLAGREGGVPSTYLVVAAAQGFWQPEQRDLLAPYVDRWFDAAVEVSARRGAAVSDAVASHGFPFHEIDAATLRAGEECLASGAPPAPLRRLLTDQLDDLGRALRVRALHP